MFTTRRRSQERLWSSLVLGRSHAARRRSSARGQARPRSPSPAARPAETEQHQCEHEGDLPCRTSAGRHSTCVHPAFGKTHILTVGPADKRAAWRFGAGRRCADVTPEVDARNHARSVSVRDVQRRHLALTERVQSLADRHGAAYAALVRARVGPSA